MRIRICSLLFALCSLLLCACDLQHKIAGVFKDDTAPAQKESMSDYGTNSESLYGARSDSMYGATGTEYASVKDYAPPKQRAESGERRASNPSARPVSQKEEIAVEEPKTESSQLSNDTDDILLVPARVAKPAKPTVVAPAQNEVVVKKGDTVYSISQKHKVPLRDLVEENKISPPYVLSVGQKLRLPGAKYHTVAAGDTLYSISRAYFVDLNSLARENNLAAPYGLAVGQKLRLPASIVPQSVAATESREQRAESKGQTTTGKEPAVKAGDKKFVSSARSPAIESVPKKSSAPVGKLPSATARASTKFSWPVRGKIISGFGAKKNGLYNDGINIGAAKGTAVKAAENGVIAYAGNELKGMGNLVIIQHSGGWMTVYAHLDSMNVRRGGRVVVGEKIGTVGATGKVGEPQLHFEIRNGTKAYNPGTQLKK